MLIHQTIGFLNTVFVKWPTLFQWSSFFPTSPSSSSDWRFQPILRKQAETIWEKQPSSNQHKPYQIGRQTNPRKGISWYILYQSVSGSDCLQKTDGENRNDQWPSYAKLLLRVSCSAGTSQRSSYLRPCAASVAPLQLPRRRSRPRDTNLRRRHLYYIYTITIMI